jgi:hypothetical protein
VEVYSFKQKKQRNEADAEISSKIFSSFWQNPQIVFNDNLFCSSHWAQEYPYRLKRESFPDTSDTNMEYVHENYDKFTIHEDIWSKLGKITKP